MGIDKRSIGCRCCSGVCNGTLCVFVHICGCSPGGTIEFNISVTGLDVDYTNSCKTKTGKCCFTVPGNHDFSVTVSGVCGDSQTTTVHVDCNVEKDVTLCLHCPDNSPGFCLDVHVMGCWGLGLPEAEVSISGPGGSQMGETDGNGDITFCFSGTGIDGLYGITVTHDRFITYEGTVLLNSTPCVLTELGLSISMLPAEPYCCVCMGNEKNVMPWCYQMIGGSNCGDLTIFSCGSPNSGNCDWFGCTMCNWGQPASPTDQLTFCGPPGFCITAPSDIVNNLDTPIWVCFDGCSDTGLYGAVFVRISDHNAIGWRSPPDCGCHPFDCECQIWTVQTPDCAHMHGPPIHLTFIATNVILKGNPPFGSIEVTFFDPGLPWSAPCSCLGGPPFQPYGGAPPFSTVTFNEAC